jgi:hypothetical protein
MASRHGRDSAGIAAYGERVGQLSSTEAGKSRPVLLIQVGLILEWFPAILSGNLDKYAEVSWHLTKKLMAMNDESKDAYSRLTEEERELVKPISLIYTFLSGEAFMRAVAAEQSSPFGPHGDKLVEWAAAYRYEKHHTYIAEIISMDCWFNLGGAEWLLTMQYGRIADAKVILQERTRVMDKVDADTSSPTRKFDLVVAIPNLLLHYHIHSQSRNVQKMCKLLGFTFDSVGDYISELTKDLPVGSSVLMRWDC